MEDPSSYVLIATIRATFGSRETLTKALDHVASMEWYSGILLLPSNRQLWILRVERERASRDYKTGFVLFSDPLQYRYKNEDTGETFISTNIDGKEAYEEFLKKYE
jgi:hypothetical protein